MDLRNEIEHIFNRGYNWYQNNLGEAVIWHEFDSRHSEYHPVYDEGGRHYTAGVEIPVLWVIINEDRATNTDEGRKPTENLTCAISARALDMSGISDPEDYARRLNDVIRYDERLWKVTDFNIRGRIPNSVVIGVRATQIYRDEEMVFDELPPGMELAGNHRAVNYPNNSDNDFEFHDGPGEYFDFYTDFDLPPAPTTPPWVAPVGGVGAYQMGDKVTHEGKTWESTADDNSGEPGVAGWVEA